MTSLRPWGRTPSRTSSRSVAASGSTPRPAPQRRRARRPRLRVDDRPAGGAPGATRRDLPIFSGRLGAVSEARDGTGKLLLSFSRGGDAEGELAVETVHPTPQAPRRRWEPTRSDPLRLQPGGLPGRVSVLRLGTPRSRTQPRTPRDPRAVHPRPRARPAQTGRGHGDRGAAVTWRTSSARWTRSAMRWGSVLARSPSPPSASPAASGASRNAAPGSSWPSPSTPPTRSSATTSSRP